MDGGPVGIFGGTFDPPHIIHVLIAEAAYRQLGLERVVFVPAGSPWQKTGETVASAEHRLGMTLAAVADWDVAEVDDREVRRPGPTYTIDTLLERGDDCPVLILGADAARGLPTWHRAEEVMDLARVAVVPRPGEERAAVDEALGGRAEWLDMPEFPVSGSEIRAKAERRGNIHYLLPQPVWAYILVHGLYGYGAGDAKVGLMNAVASQGG